MRSVTKRRAAASATMLTAIVASVSATALHAQRDPRPTYDSVSVPWLGAEADSVRTTVLGGSFVFATGAGEALDNTGLGLGLELNAGYSFGRVTELRIGATASSFSDELSRDDELSSANVKLYGLFVENLYKKGVPGFVLHVGFRVVWMWQSRSIYTNTPNGPGIGLFAGGRRRINPRVALEGNASWTSISFDAANIEGLPDLDQANGTVWGIRLGLAYFVNRER